MAEPDVVEHDGRGGRRRYVGLVALVVVLVGLATWRMVAVHKPHRAAPPDGATLSRNPADAAISLIVSHDRRGFAVWDTADGTRRALGLPSGAADVYVSSAVGGTGFTVAGVAGGRGFDQNYSPAGAPLTALQDLGPAVAVGGGVFSPQFTVLPGQPGRLHAEPVLSAAPLPAGWSVRELVGEGLDAIVARPAQRAELTDVAVWSPGASPVPIAAGVHLLSVADRGAVAWVDASCPADPPQCLLHVTDAVTYPTTPGPSPQAHPGRVHVLRPPAGFGFLPTVGAWEGTGYLALFGERIATGRPVVLYAMATMTSAQLVPGSDGADPAAGLMWAGKDLVFAQSSDIATAPSTGESNPPPTLTAAVYDFVADSAQPLDVQLPPSSTLLGGG